MTSASTIPPAIRDVLTKAQSIILEELLRAEVAKHADINQALRGDIRIADEAMCLKVHIHKLRKTLAPLNIVIKTVRGRGYSLTDESRAVIASMMKEPV